MEKARIEAESYGQLIHWYQVLGEFLKKNKIQANELYNWDETGFQLGIGTKENVVSTRQNETIGTGGIGQNITGIECISADGWVMHPWFLIRGSEHMEDWFEDDDNIANYRVIKPTSKGWTDDTTAIQWLLDFHFVTKKRVTRGRPRVLIMDNHRSYGTPEFEHIYQSFNIIPYWFIPKMTYRCQPLDGKLFAVLKQRFRRKNNEILRWGGDVNNKRHFFQMIKSVRKDTFKSQTIKSAFADTGIWPWDPKIVPDQIDPGWEDEPILEIYGHTPSPDAEIPSSQTNSPPNTPHRWSKIENKVETIFKNDQPDLLKIQKYVKRAIRGGKQALQDLNLAKQTIKRMQKHKIPVKKSRRIIKGASKSPLSSIAGNIRVHRRAANENRVEIRREIGNARIRDYWYRAQQALKEKEEASGERDYIDENSELFKWVDPDDMLGGN